jgi:hypothetical protein
MAASSIGSERREVTVMSSEGSGKPPVQIPNATREPTAMAAATSEPAALENGEFRTISAE